MTIDLSLLPPPDVVETIDYEAILAARKARLISLYPADQQAEVTAALAVESDPMLICLQEMAYQETLLRQRVNEAARQCHLASATGSNLDHLAALLGVTRLITAPGDPDAIPPVAPTWETDASLRYRAQLAVEGMSTAGPSGAYRYHALSAHGDVADASVLSPTPGQVLVTVLSNDGDGTAPDYLLEAVDAALNAENVRPLTDEVIVQGATIVPYTIEAQLTLYPGPAPAPVLAAAQAAAAAYAAQTHRLGYDVTLSGLYAALHQAGVQRVTLSEPAADVICGPGDATYCTGITITLAEAPDV